MSAAFKCDRCSKLIDGTATYGRTVIFGGPSTVPERVGVTIDVAFIGHGGSPDVCLPCLHELVMLATELTS
jgi:hypothetical protein